MDARPEARRGTILIVDGDFVNVGRVERMLKALAKTMERVGLLKADPQHAPLELTKNHNDISFARSFFERGGAELVAGMLGDAGFEGMTIEHEAARNP